MPMIRSLACVLLIVLVACAPGPDRPAGQPASSQAKSPAASTPSDASQPAAPAAKQSQTATPSAVIGRKSDTPKTGPVGSDLTPDPALHLGQLPNGLRYGLLHHAQPAGKVCFRLRIATGSMNESDPQQGLAHYLEHMAFNGTKNFPGGTLVERLQAAGLAFGAHTNAHTSFDETVYKLDLPDTKPETIDLALTVLADQAGGMLLLPDEVEKERGVILSEMRDRDGPGRRIQTAQNAAIYAGTNIPRREPIGLETTVRGATAELLRDYYQRWYVAERMVFSAVGDIEPSVLEQAVRAKLGGLAKGSGTADLPVGALIPDSGAELRLADPEAKATEVSLIRVRERQRPADTVESRRAQFLADLGEGVIRRRLAKVVESRGDGALLSGMPFSYQWMFCYHTGVEGQARPGQGQAALAVLIEEYRRMLDHGPTPGELAIEAAGVASDLDQAVESAASRTNRDLSNVLVDKLGEEQVLLSPEQNRALYKRFLVEATPASVQNALREAWGQGGRLAVLATGRDPGLIDRAALLDWSKPTTPPAATAKLAWGYPVPPAAITPATAARFGKVGDDGLARATFDTLPVIVRPSSEQPGSVGLRLVFQVRTHPSPAAVPQLAAGTFFAGGLGKHTVAEIREIFADSSVSLSGPGSSGDQIILGFSCRPADFAQGCQRLAAALADPGWRPEAAQRVIASWRESLAAKETDLDQRVQDAALAAATGDRPWRRPATLAEVDALNPADAKSWLMPLLAKAPRAIVVAGDIDPVVAMTEIATHLANRPEVAAPAVFATPTEAKAALAPADPWTPGKIELEVPGKVARDAVLILWPTDDIYDIGQARRLNLLSDALEEKIRVRLREELGQAYSPSANHNPGDGWIGWGQMVVSASVAHGAADGALKAIDAVVADLRDRLVDADTFTRIRTPLLAQLPALRKRNDWWLGTVLTNAPIQPFRLDWSKTLETDYAAITAEELRTLAQKFLVDGRRIVVIGRCAGAPEAK